MKIWFALALVGSLALIGFEIEYYGTVELVAELEQFYIIDSFLIRDTDKSGDPWAFGLHAMSAKSS